MSANLDATATEDNHLRAVRDLTDAQVEERIAFRRWIAARDRTNECVDHVAGITALRQSVGTEE